MTRRVPRRVDHLWFVEIVPFAGEDAVGRAVGPPEHMHGVLMLDDPDVTPRMQVPGDRYSLGDGESRRHTDRESEAVTELRQRPECAVVVAELAMGGQRQRQWH
ncbi:hypothetical protein SAMN02745121_08432 [Nannocystis exedens]|uniref:Uncharacterized protein n=1 Tax=Nannocystis exedens TaxID=54 RepID=A0A1I2I3W6_9BACT|nr:hypothetical protein NAEX_07739 [Nannocystis exedens]SFF37119.1 hypothetical protein SAMN02745121_08432 [Nannocystis exedens]